ncbi:hypothetical protein AVEN_269135-1 [Araneus ventricosus]|uniref:Transposase Tc1-like domain-containing protein n=1 Tax=Araneus ventricosus TaxID=182803 RepID=A0A4Y2H028_ARAVE|nr:hypothetical protein AVEN_269135-1 [Araneus ventricosus]
MSRKYVSDFKKGEITGQHQSKKTTKEIAEITGIGLRSLQRIIKTWKDSGEPSTSQNKMWLEKTHKFTEPKVSESKKKNRKKSTFELTAMLNTGHINTHMRRELKGMEFNSCRPKRKKLASAINRKKLQSHPFYTKLFITKFLLTRSKYWTLFIKSGVVLIHSFKYENAKYG